MMYNSDYRELLLCLDENRRNRIQSNGRPKFNITREEALSSSRAAMRVAKVLPENFPQDLLSDDVPKS